MQTLKEIIQYVEAKNPAPGKCLISFSGGKDAWCCWFALREHFETTLFSYYIVPGLELVDEYLDYCERKTGQKIYRYPHPETYENLKRLEYQPPERIKTIYTADLPENLTKDSIARVAEQDAGLPENMWCAIGARAADSIARSSAMKRHGVINDKRRTFFPVWDWKKDDVVGALKKNNVRLSLEYPLYGRTFDGVFLMYALALKEHHPRDYQKVLDFYPLVELEIFRYEQALKKYGGVDKLPRDVVVAGGNKKATSKFSFSLARTTPRQDQKEDKYSDVKAERNKVRHKMQNMINPNFWASIHFPDASRFQIVFEDFDQREHFFRELKLLGHGVKYLDGRYVAAKLQIKGFPAFPIMEKPVLPPCCMDSIEYSDDIEQDSKKEFEALLAACPKPVKFAGSQAEKFLKKAGWRYSEQGHCWAEDIAPLYKIKLPATSYYYRPFCTPDKKLNALAGGY